MKIELSLKHAGSIPRFDLRRLWRRASSHHEYHKNFGPDPAEELREALCREAILIRQRSFQAEEQEALRDESDHRLLNGLQMIVSLLKLQSRAAVSPEAALQLSVAANRVATIERIHRRLHMNDGTQNVAFKKYLEDFCAEFSGVMAGDEASRKTISVQCAEISLPTTVAVPLGFIVNELITNAVKYGNGRIVVGLEKRLGGSYALDVANDGPALPEGFDPAASKGLGLKIVKSFVRKIGGELIVGRGAASQGARFTVLFS